MNQRVQRWMLALLLAACLAAWALPALAQEAAPQYVDSLEAQEKRIEGLVTERLTALLPSGNFVVRATVSGGRERIPRAAVSGTNLDLPGFRPSAGESVPGVEKFRVRQVAVRVVLNQDVPPSDLQYLRTIVPILADFRTDRGDTLDLQVVPTQGAGGQRRGALGNDTPFGLSWQEWLLVGVLVLLLFVLLTMMWRLAGPRRMAQPAMAAAPVAAAPAPARDDTGVSAADQRRMDQERQRDDLRHAVVKRLFARPELARDLVSSWSTSPGKLGDLMHGLDLNIARQVLLPHLGREEYQAMEAKAYGEQADVGRVLTALRDANLFMMAQEIVNPEQFRPNPFAFLDKLTWGQIAHLIRDEPVKIKAIVLSRLKSDDTARILETMPKDVQLELAVNIGHLQDLPLDMASSVATDLASKTRNLPDPRMVEIEGPMALVDMMSRASSDTSRYLLEAMKSKDAGLSEEVEKRFFMFEAIPLVPDEALPQAVRTLPSSVVIQAMQGASPELQRKIIMAFPEQARTGLVTALRASRAEPEAVQDARREVVAKFREMARQGRIDLKQISDAWQAQAKAS